MLQRLSIALVGNLSKRNSRSTLKLRNHTNPPVDLVQGWQLSVFLIPRTVKANPSPFSSSPLVTSTVVLHHDEGAVDQSLCKRSLIRTLFDKIFQENKAFSSHEVCVVARHTKARTWVDGEVVTDLNRALHLGGDS